ncbi:MAG TPA: hypothetical protein VMT86_08340 [Bryobacteraceae bacterium]|nr:hypothetical protein [Bryobacteraceae bacterium]
MPCRALLLLPLLAGSLAAQYGTTPKANAEAYAAHATLGGLSLGAEYMMHSFSGHGQTYIVRDYLVVEVALFCPPGTVVTPEARQFTLRVNGRNTLAPQDPEIVAVSLKHNDWGTYPHAEAGAGPVVLGAPQPTERFPGDPGRMPRVPTSTPRDADPNGVGAQPPVTAEELVVQAALPQGEHRGPVSGYLYFSYQGKAKRIRTLELEFAGPQGDLTLPLDLTPR